MPEPLERRHRVEASRLRYRCDPKVFDFETTAEIDASPMSIIGQPRAMEALQVGLALRGHGQNVFLAGTVGSGRSTVVRRALERMPSATAPPEDLVFVHNFEDPDRPHLLRLPAGDGGRFRRLMEELVGSLRSDLPRLFESELYRSRRSQRVEDAGAEQKALLRTFEERLQEQGFALVQEQMGPYVRSQVLPEVEGEPVAMDDLEAKVEAEEYERLQEVHGRLQADLEVLSKRIKEIDRQVRETLTGLDREVARPMIEDAVARIEEAFSHDKLATFLEQVAADFLDHLADFRKRDEGGDAEGGAPPPDWSRYEVNPVVDNAKTRHRPVIWESAPTHRNLFGTIDTVRTEGGGWHADHTGIKSGSLMRASGGVLVLDAMDVLAEDGVWAALKRTLRHRKVELQGADHAPPFLGISLSPEPVDIDVKVVLIGTYQIYGALFRLDEDFSKIFKVKAELATRVPQSDDELRNFARLIRKRCTLDELPPFHRGAVAAVVEHASRLAGHNRKLTTRFTEVTDVVRESGYWARRRGADLVRVEDVEEALWRRVHRVDLFEETLREKIVEGELLLDIAGARVAQVNGLAVLDSGDHRFGKPSRITATTAMGRAGIVAIDREADLSGAIHTKGVLILTGFLRERFAQRRPLTLSASLCFEQSYGGIDGDSASSTELYALLSSLSGVPLRQDVAVTGSVNQRGEVQPVGGINEKIEGFYDLCRIVGLDGNQGVMIPRANLAQLTLRRDVAEEVEKGRFHVWSVSTIEEGLEVLTGVEASSVFERAEARLAELAEAVTEYGPADGD